MTPGVDDGNDDLGAFSSESEVGSVPPHASAQGAGVRGSARHALESPALVPILVAIAAIGYGLLMVVWWEREAPQVKSAISPAPTRSFRPSAPQPPASEPAVPAGTTAAAPSVAEPLDELPARMFVPAVAGAGAAPPRAGAAVVLPVPPPVLDAPENVASALPPVIDVAAPAAPAPAPAPEPVAIEPRPVDRRAADRTAIGDVLMSYRTAYNALDATSVSTIWQGLDTRALQKAFATLSSQDVRFDKCDVRVTDSDQAEASCRGVLSYVPKIGDGSPQQRRLSWDFGFRRAADRWLISSVSAR